MSKKGRAISFSIVSLICCAIIAYGVLSFSTETINEKVYPLKYSETVDKVCKERNLDPSFIYAVIKTESNFDENAVSPANAKGLMQIMPDSFSWIQRYEDGEVTYEEDDLFKPEINIKYGCAIFQYFYERYEDEYTAAAAYNAGPGNVDSWLSNSEYSLDGKTLYNIPFTETRNYVKKIKDIQNEYIELYFKEE